MNGNWRGNGFLIKPNPPRGWDLYEAGQRDETSPVAVEGVPFASLPTLNACKYKAEALHDRAATASLRSRLSVVAATSVGIMMVARPHPLLAMACIVIALAALLELAATWFEDLPGRAGEIVQ